MILGDVLGSVCERKRSWHNRIYHPNIVEEQRKPTNKCSSGVAGLEVWSRMNAITRQECGYHWTAAIIIDQWDVDLTGSEPCLLLAFCCQRDGYNKMWSFLFARHEGIQGSRRTVLRSYLNTRWMWVINFTLRSLHPNACLCLMNMSNPMNCCITSWILFCITSRNERRRAMVLQTKRRSSLYLSHTHCGYRVFVFVAHVRTSSVCWINPLKDLCDDYRSLWSSVDPGFQSRLGNRLSALMFS